MKPEAIGRVGELKFDELCNEVNVNSSTQTPDLNGIDRYVEFPQAKAHPFFSLDTRPATLSCYVQIKTISYDQSRWKISLSNAEKLAKSIKPTFLVLFKLNNNGKISWGGLAHFKGDLLTRTLKRLREAEYKNQFDLNKIHLTLTQENAETFTLTGTALIEKIKSCIGENMALYSQSKEHELSFIGFEHDRLKAQIKYKNVSPEELVDAQLNATPLSFESINFSEKRFGITLPARTHFLSGGQITMEPAKYENCQFLIKGCDTHTTVILPCEIHVATVPNKSLQYFKFNVITNTMTISFSSTNFQISHPAFFDESFSQPLETWRNTFKLLDLLLKEKCRISLKINEFNEEAQIGTTSKYDHKRELPIPTLLKTTEAALFLIKEANSNDNAISLPSLLNNYKEIISAYAALCEEEDNTPLEYSLSNDQLSSHPQKSPLLYINFITMDDRTFAYAVRSTTQRINGTNKFKSSQLVPVSIKELGKERTLDEYNEFTQRVRTITGITRVIIEAQIDYQASELINTG